MTTETGWFAPDWLLPPGVRALQTVRTGGLSGGAWTSFNLGDHVGDDPAVVAGNRARLTAAIAAHPHWLQQVHGTVVCDLDTVGGAVSEADAAVARMPGKACVIMTADCLPLLFCDRSGSVVAAAHAGWRGLLAGVIEATVHAMRVPGEDVSVWLGPAIGPAAFEVGAEVRVAFVAEDAMAVNAFEPAAGGKWLADLFALARLRLARVGITQIYGGGVCTYGDPQRFFSYRRDGVTGRMASLIWRE